MMLSLPAPERLFEQGSDDTPLGAFHPWIREWFGATLGQPSPPQVEAWPLLREGRHVLVAAPTGSGKTLTAFLTALDGLLRRALAGTLEEGVQVVYVSPLRALATDIEKNLWVPLRALDERSRRTRGRPLGIRAQVRTGDTSPAERAALVRKPPHLLVTTPESLYLTLSSPKARRALTNVETVVVDELHALARDKRGAHFALTLERLAHHARRPPQRVGLSATIEPIDGLADYLKGPEARCEVVRCGHLRPWELSIEVPDGELGAVTSNEAWGSVYDRLCALSEGCRTLLVFANSRRLAERVAHDLGERLGPGEDGAPRVAAHHGSLAPRLRLAAEERLKAGTLRILVATASLELGIDIGSVDAVAQLGSPRAIATFLQRVGRSGHHLGGVSRGVLFALTRDELVECAALMTAVRKGRLDAVRLPGPALDVLAQQAVASCLCEGWDEAELLELFRRAPPYRGLTDAQYAGVLELLSEGVSAALGRRTALLNRDRVGRSLEARKGAQLRAMLGAGTIPDTFLYPVLAEPDGRKVGELDEDFAVDSNAGDVFLLGSTSWRILGVRQGTVRVADAEGQAPSLPFWQGEAFSRTAELSEEVSLLREKVGAEGGADGRQRGPGKQAGAKALPLERQLQEDSGLSAPLAAEVVGYLRSVREALGVVPSQDMVVAERFFDEAGGMQLLLHAPFGARINRAWGLALRKCFCRSFDFELQAAATDDGVLLSLGAAHSFPLADIFRFVSSSYLEKALTQAVLQTPLFPTRFRHVATRALALQRLRAEGRVPPPIQRARAEDLLAAVFPQQVGCQDNRGGGDIEVPDHPLVAEALHECLRELMDVDGLRDVLERLERGELAFRAVDTAEPSPMAEALLNSAPSSYLDDAPLEERRARAVSTPRSRAMPGSEAGTGAGTLDRRAVADVRATVRPRAETPGELHDALLTQGALWEDEVSAVAAEALVSTGRALRLLEPGSTRALLTCPERLPHLLPLHPSAELRPPTELLGGDALLDRAAAVRWRVSAEATVAGPFTAPELAARLALPAAEVEEAMLHLEASGQLLRGCFREAPGAPSGELSTAAAVPEGAEAGAELEATAPAHDEPALEMCDRVLLQRIHRATRSKLSREVAPLTGRELLRFLFRWHAVEKPGGGPAAVHQAIARLQGFHAPAALWESALIKSRVQGYRPAFLERLCFSGEVVVCRLAPEPRRGPPRGHPIPDGAGTVPLGLVPAQGLERSGEEDRAPRPQLRLTLVFREDLPWLQQAARWLSGPQEPSPLSAEAIAVASVLEARGACFVADIATKLGMKRDDVDRGLLELLARGRAAADGPDVLRVRGSGRGAGRSGRPGLGAGSGMLPGRFSLLELPESRPDEALFLEPLAWLLLERWGILCRELLSREPLAPPWRLLLPVLRGLERTGQLRGGRFVKSFAGEQFALPAALDLARSVRRERERGGKVTLCAADPLHLAGLLEPGVRAPMGSRRRVVYEDGALGATGSRSEKRVPAPSSLSSEASPPAAATVW